MQFLDSTCHVVDAPNGSFSIYCVEVDVEEAEGLVLELIDEFKVSSMSIRNIIKTPNVSPCTTSTERIIPKT